MTRVEVSILLLGYIAGLASPFAYFWLDWQRGKYRRKADEW